MREKTKALCRNVGIHSLQKNLGLDASPSTIDHTDKDIDLAKGDLAQSVAASAATVHASGICCKPATEKPSTPRALRIAYFFKSFFQIPEDSGGMSKGIRGKKA